MNTDLYNEDILLDRLADGELSADERRRLLESLDARPDGWRRCALAFLEAQSWREGFGEVARERVETKSAATTSSVVVAVGNRTAMKRGLAWLAVAAGLLVAVTLGVMQRDSGPPIAGIEPNPNKQIVAAAPPAAAPDEGNADDALTLWVLDDGGKARSVRVPLMDAGTLDRQLGLEFQTGLSSVVRNQLQERGYDVQSKRRYAPLWLENGRPMIVPVEDTKIVPVGQNVY